MTDDLGQSVPRNVVMFSGGIGSWATAKLVADRTGTHGLVLLFADTKMEDEDTYRFIEAGAANVGGELVRLEDGRDIWQVFRDVKFLGNTRIDPCSRILKRELMRKWVDKYCNPATTTVYVGIDWTEQHRAKRYAAYWHPFKVDCPLTRSTMTKADMLAWAKHEGLPSQRLYEWGFHHANCGGGCVKAGLKAFSRSQQRADAHNKVSITRIMIQNAQHRSCRDHPGNTCKSGGSTLSGRRRKILEQRLRVLRHRWALAPLGSKERRHLPKRGDGLAVPYRVRDADDRFYRDEQRPGGGPTCRDHARAIGESVMSQSARREIARIYRVPYWLVTGEPKPSWWRAPMWRLCALMWGRF